MRGETAPSTDLAVYLALEREGAVDAAEEGYLRLAGEVQRPEVAAAAWMALVRVRFTRGDTEGARSAAQTLLTRHPTSYLAPDAKAFLATGRLPAPDYGRPSAAEAPRPARETAPKPPPPATLAALSVATEEAAVESTATAETAVREERADPTVPAQTISLDVPDSVEAGVPFAVRILVLDDAGRAWSGPLPRPEFASPLGVSPVVGRGDWNEGVAEEVIAVTSEGIDQPLTVRIGENSAEARIHSFPRPASVDELVRKAEAKLAGGEPLEAIDALQEAHARAPDRADVVVWMGEAYIQAGMWEEAYRAFRKSLRMALVPEGAGSIPIGRPRD